MILNLRVDHRLLHGQVALSWTAALGADCILIANDDAATNDIRKTTLKLAKPSGVKLVIKRIAESIAAINSGATNTYRLFIVVETIGDAYALAKQCTQIQAITLGGTRPRPGTKSISKTIYVTDEERDRLRELMDCGIEIEIRMIPVDGGIDARRALEKGGSGA